MSLNKTKGNLGPRKPLSAPEESTMPAPSVAAGFIEPARTKLTVHIDEDLHRRFKSTVAASGQTMRAVVEEVLEDWVKRNAS